MVMDKFKKYLRYVLLGGVFLIPFIPFLVSNEMFFPFITLKNFTFRIIVEIIFASWIILAVLDHSYRPKRSWILVALGAFLAIIALADVFGENPAKSFWSNYERMEGLVTHIHLFAYFIVATSILTTEKLWVRFLQTSLVASVLMAGFVMTQLAGIETINQGGDRVDGKFGNATYLAVYALFHIFIAAFLFVKRSSVNWVRWVYAVVALLNLFVLYNTQTRGAILGLIGGTLLSVLLIAIFERENKLARKISAGVIAGIILLVGLFIVAKDSSFVRESETLNRFAEISLTEKTTKSRFQVWGLALEGFKENPILGSGQENFNLVFSDHYDPRLYDQEPFFDRAHNVFLDWLTAGGALGLLAYLSIFMAALYYIWSLPERGRSQTGREGSSFSIIEKSILTGLLGAYFIQNLFVFDNLMSYVLFFSVLGYIHMHGEKDVVSDVKPKEVSEYAQYIIITLVLVFLAVAMYSVNIKNINANRALLQAISPHEEGLQANTDYFKKALAYDTFGNAEIRERLIQHAATVSGIQNVPDQFKQDLFIFARSEMLKQVEETPKDVRYEILLGSYLNRFGQHEEAIAHLKRAIQLSPNKQSTYFELVSVYVNSGQYELARDIAKTAYELEKSNRLAVDMYAVASLYAGDTQLAESLIVEQYGTLIADNDNILNAYARIGAHDLVVEIWKKRIAELQSNGEDNPQFHVSLAAAYIGTGERTKAVQELQKAIELNPEFKDQGQYYINEIQAGRNP